MSQKRDKQTPTSIQEITLNLSRETQNSIAKLRNGVSIEKMAEDYAAKILNVYPSGRINLLGFSIGGYVAFEMAKIFKEKKREVSFVGIIDTPAPHFLQQHPLLKRLQNNASHFWELSTKEKKEFLITRWEELEQKTSHIFKSGGQENVDDIPQSLKTVLQKAMAHYDPMPLQIPLTIMIAQEEPKYPGCDSTKGWKNYTDNIAIEKIPGQPQDILDMAAIKHMADILKKRLIPLQD